MLSQIKPLSQPDGNHLYNLTEIVEMLPLHPPITEKMD